MPFIIITAAILIVALICGIIALLHEYVSDEMRRYKLTEGYNKVNGCRECRRYFRKWQSDLASASLENNDGIMRCPHCESENVGSVITYSKLFDRHRDCPKLGTWKRYLMLRRITKVEDIMRRLREIDEMKEYEERRK